MKKNQFIYSIVVIILFFGMNVAKAKNASDIIETTVPLIQVQPIDSQEVVVPPLQTLQLTERQQKNYQKKLRRDSIRAKQRVWWSVLGGPSYTPEASLGLGGALLATFKIKKTDTISYRSFVPVGFNVSLNGTYVVAGTASLFFNENKFRIYATYSFRREPSNYFGKGFSSVNNISMSDSTTLFHKTSLLLYPRFLWQVMPHFFVGPLLDVNYTHTYDVNPVMQEDPYFKKFKGTYTNVGLGGVVQYDTRDDIATPQKGLLLSATGKLFGKYIGGSYNYQFLDLEYRQFVPLFHRRSVLGWVARSQISFGDVPFTELPSFGSPFDLRGYYLGKYRDKSMAYGIVEYRHMFGSQASYNRGNFWAKTGFVVWVGTGTLGNTPLNWTTWKFNYGAGLRIQLQPGKNFRLDFGREPGTKGILFYMNMTEAF